MRNEDVILYVPVRQCIVLRLREPSGRLSERRVQGPPGPTRGPGDSSRFLSIFLRPKEGVHELETRARRGRPPPASMEVRHQEIRPNAEDRRRGLAIARAGTGSLSLILRPATLEILRRHRSGLEREAEDRELEPIADHRCIAPGRLRHQEEPGRRRCRSVPRPHCRSTRRAPRVARRVQEDVAGLAQPSGRGGERLGDAAALHRAGLLSERRGHAWHRRLPHGRLPARAVRRDFGPERRWVTARRSWPPPAIGLPTIPTSSCPRSGSSRRMSSFTSTDERTSRRSPRACSGWAPNPRSIKKSPDERKRTGEQLEELVQDRRAWCCTC